MNVAVIGVGNMGQHHARIYSELPQVNLVGICDLDKKRGTDIARLYGVNYYQQLEDLLEKEALDAVSIAVPTAFHYSVAQTCLKKGINVLLEKPIATNIEDAKKIVSLANKNKIVLLIGHIERFNPSVQKLKSMVENGDMGEITALISRRVGGIPPAVSTIDIATDLAIHDVDISNYLLDKLPTKISVNKQRYHSETFDSVEFFLQYGSTTAYIQANWITPVKIRKLHVTGTEGYVEVDYITQQLDYYKSNSKRFSKASSDFSEYILQFSTPEKQVITIEKKEPLKEEILFFLNAVQQKKMIDNNHAIDSLKITLF